MTVGEIFSKPDSSEDVWAWVDKKREEMKGSNGTPPAHDIMHKGGYTPISRARAESRAPHPAEDPEPSPE